VAVLFLDLDNFKVVNDSLGHQMGDALLITLAERLRACVRPTDVIARLGGDEFTILLPDVTGDETAVCVAERIADELRVPFVLKGQEVWVTASIGVLRDAQGYSRPDDLLRDADVAMYRAKTGGKARYVVFDRAWRRWPRTDCSSKLTCAMASSARSSS
jgi:diguanylate cyclase (GGDEF)-like protein